MLFKHCWPPAPCSAKPLKPAPPTPLPSSYPVQAFLKFSDGSNRKVADEQLQPPVGTGRMFGPFQQVPGKSISQVNFRIGANKDPQATGFSYRISVQGCH